LKTQPVDGGTNRIICSDVGKLWNTICSVIKVATVFKKTDTSLRHQPIDGVEIQKIAGKKNIRSGQQVIGQTVRF